MLVLEVGLMVRSIRKSPQLVAKIFVANFAHSASDPEFIEDWDRGRR